MKQLIQSYRTGALSSAETPTPSAKPHHVLVQTAASLVSVGTEKYMLELAKKSLVGKALARPDLVQRVIQKAQAEGVMEAWRQAMGRLDSPVPLGYSSAGTVIAVGEGVTNVVVGQRVACSGSGYAGHSEVSLTPARLCVPLPDGVDFEQGAFVALGGIALQAVRMAQVSLGETVAVIGLGLIGQITIQLLAAAGCRVIGIDLDPNKAEMALRYGAERAVSNYASLESAVRRMTGGHGVDATIILAATTSNEPLDRSAEITRERGRIVAAGLVGLTIPRTPFYDKELELVVSRAWGPGLYDENYTGAAVDYPPAYARWTAERNTAAFLQQVARGSVKLGHLISHRFDFASAEQAYQMILAGEQPFSGVVLTYPDAPTEARPTVTVQPRAFGSGQIGVGLIGAGLFASGTLLPVLSKLPAFDLRGIATQTGTSARHAAEKFGIATCTTDYRTLLADPTIQLIIILTRHGSHARFVREALAAGKHVFVEKPLATTTEQLEDVVEAVRSAENAQLMVGFNRRFSPFSQWIKQSLADVGEPLGIQATINAGFIPAEHWVHHPEQGAGRIIGEMCHYVDLIQYWCGYHVERVQAEAIQTTGYELSDNVMATLRMANGSIATITYLAGGDRKHPRERFEIYGGNTVAVLDNFRAASVTRGGKTQTKRNRLAIEWGYTEELTALESALKHGRTLPTSLADLANTTATTFAIEQAIRVGMPVLVRSNDFSRSKRDD